MVMFDTSRLLITFSFSFTILFNAKFMHVKRLLWKMKRGINYDEASTIISIEIKLNKNKLFKFSEILNASSLHTEIFFVKTLTDKS